MESVLNIAPETIDAWRSRTKEATDVVTASPIARFNAWLDHEAAYPKDGDTAPLGSHMLFFLSTTRQSLLAPEGGNPRDDFEPPIPLQRKMWVGSRLWFYDEMHVGDELKLVCRIKSLVPKSTRSGQVVILTYREEVHGPRGICMVEEYDVVYRQDPKEGDSMPQAQMRPGTPTWTRSVLVDAPLLFRFSALTYNSHRIHYDQPYTTQVEGYPGLLVTGPLQEAMLLDFAQRNAAKPVKEFSCRAVRPLFCGTSLQLEGVPTEGGVQLWTCDPEGVVGMTATVSYA